jgi:hypothetical protein
MGTVDNSTGRTLIMRTVLKYPIFEDDAPVTPITYIEVRSRSLAKNPIPRSAGLDLKGCPCIWIEQYDDGQEVFGFNIYIVGTNKKVPLDAKYLGSFANTGIGEMWHIYYEPTR